MVITKELIQSFFELFHRTEISDSSMRNAAVLLPIFPHNELLHILFTKRTLEVEHHKGQISFPGGTTDPSDTNAIDTALRETEEEIGFVKTSIEVLGLYNDYRTPSGFCITPVIGFLQVLPSLNLESNEVLETFSVPLEFFLQQKNERLEKLERNGKQLDVYFYNYDKYCIWGATAAILRGFLKSLEQFSIVHQKVIG